MLYPSGNIKNVKEVERGLLIYIFLSLISVVSVKMLNKILSRQSQDKTRAVMAQTHGAILWSPQCGV